MKYKKELDLLKMNINDIYERSNELIIDVSFKGEEDIVTSTDLFIEKSIIEVIKSRFPNDHFHTEEFNSETTLKNRTWLIDPIDGTTNYAVGLDFFVLQIALYDQGDIVLSYIYAPKQNNTYYAIKGFGVYLNEKRYYINDKKTSNFMVSMVGLTQDRIDRTYFYRLIDLSIDNKFKIRMLGSIGFELALTSEGMFNIFYTNVTNLWDLFPGVLLLKEAGAILLNEKGEPYQLKDKNLFVCKDEKTKKLLIDSII
ncbi:MAG: inositol monophosphatase [Candidatus Izimaplasma sp.]|nr:inositol monophosphatase [Candidatus Izimaplasma bacterium]